jgi:hypothetical protein
VPGTGQCRIEALACAVPRFCLEVDAGRGNGGLQALPQNYEAAKLIPALEAVLVEALEPRQNRKRGDDLAAVEYVQRVDPEIEKKQLKAAFDAALNKS